MVDRPFGISMTIVVVVWAMPALASGVPAEPPRNGPPLADAGLDQRVEYGSTVRLDATGSRDPDGEIEGYQWSIDRPNGTSIGPACDTCARTSFRPEAVGTYEVTVTVTDDDGATASDTLYVEVQAGAGPGVSLTGPTEPSVGTASTYVARVSAGDQAVDRITWFVDERQKNRTPTRVGNATGQFRFSSTGARNVTVSVTDEAGKTATDSVTVRPRPEPSPVVSSSSGGENDRSIDGKYSSDRNIWLENGGVNTYEQAVDLAKGNTNDLPENVVGGLNDGGEPWDKDGNSGGTTTYDETYGAGNEVDGADEVEDWSGGIGG